MSKVVVPIPNLYLVPLLSMHGVHLGVLESVFLNES
jgi:hypothetical protein